MVAPTVPVSASLPVVLKKSAPMSIKTASVNSTAVKVAQQMTDITDPSSFTVFEYITINIFKIYI